MEKELANTFERLADKGYLWGDYPLAEFVKQKHDKRQKWLRFRSPANEYKTSINKTQWKELSDLGKASVINHARMEMWGF